MNRGSTPRTPRTRTRRNATHGVALQRAGRAAIEALEERQLMSMTIELLDANGGTSSQVTAVGQVVNLNVFAYIKGTNSNPAADTVQDVAGSFLGNGSSPAAIGGTLLAANYGEFQANGSFIGAQQDLNGDGNLDVGSNSTTSLHDDFFARADSEEGDGTDVNGGLMIQIGTLSYTVTTLGGGAPTEIVFRPGPAGYAFTAVWDEDDQAGGSNNLNNTFEGSAYTIEDSALIKPPVAVNDTASVYRNQTTTLSPLANDQEDLAYNLSSFTIVSQPAHGTASVNFDVATGSNNSSNLSTDTISYTPSPGFVGSDSFTYDIADSAGTVSNVATFSVSVVVPPDPTAVADSATTVRATTTNIDVLANDTFPTPAVDSSVTVTTAPANGTASVNTADGSINYTPSGLFVGTDTFQYTVTDTDGETSNPATVTVTVVRPAPPVASNSSSPVVENASVTLDLATYTTTTVGTIVPATLAIQTPPAHGTAVVQSDGDVLYTPASSYTGTDSFSYDIQNSDGDVSNVATVTLSVVPSTPPTAVASAATTDQNVQVGIDVAASDTASTDGGLDPSTIVITTAPADGTATLVTAPTTISVYNGSGTYLTETIPAGDVLYTPNPDFFGTDTFSYTIGDGYGSESTPATVTVTVNEAAAPVNGNPTQTILNGGTTLINASQGAVTNIPLVATSTTITVSPVDGTATVNASTGNITYAANAGFVGTDTLTFTAQDIDGQTSAPVTETIDVGTMLSTAKGLPRTLVFTDAAGAKQTVSITTGTAEVFFSGNGKVTTRGNTTTAAGTSLNIGSIDLANTTARGSLSVKGSAKAPLTIGSITDAAPIGTISATAATLAGTSGFNSVGTLSLLSITGTATFTSLSSLKAASITGGSITTTGSVKTPLTVSITNGTASSIVTSQTIRSFTTKSWATSASATSDATATAVITAPVISSLSVGGAFDGTVNAQTSAGSLVFRGGFGGTVLAGYVKTLEVVGNDIGLVQLNDTGTSAGSVIVTGAISGGNLYSNGSIGSISANLLDNSTIDVGVPNVIGASAISPGPALTTATAADLGTSTLGSLKITNRATGGIVNSSVLAGTIKTASVGVIAVGNNGVPQGLAAAHYGTVSGIYALRPLGISTKELAAETTLTAYLKSKGYSLGDFEIVVAS